MVVKVNHTQLEKLIKLHYDKKDKDNRKIALIIYGTFGVGKSASVKKTAQELATQKGKKFVEWNKLVKEQKEEVYAKPEDYFCLIDIRLSEFDSSDIKGLPDYKDRESIEWKVPFWAKLLEKETSDGILFFDEISLAPPLVISSTYKIIYDRIVNESKINDSWLIVGATNNADDRAYTHELSAPVKDRGSEVELIKPSADSWITNFAIPRGINSKIIGYLSWKQSNLYPQVNYDDEQKFTTARGWERVNTLMEGVDDYATLDLICTSAIGEGIAKEFVAFCKIEEGMKVEDVLKNPEILKKIVDLSTKYFIVCALAESYKDKKMSFEKVVAVTKVLDECGNADFVALLWKMCMKYAGKRFLDDSITKGKDNPLLKKYDKYILS